MTAEYLSGFFDGEGCIRIQVSGSIFKVRCCLVNTNLSVMLEIQKQFGGRLETRNTPIRLTHRQSYALNWDGTDNVKKFLQVISPFSIVKKAEIDLVLEEFIPHISETKRVRPIPHHVVSHRLELKKRLSNLKRVGYTKNQDVM